jgi:hypothetical protein
MRHVNGELHGRVYRGFDEGPQIRLKRHYLACRTNRTCKQQRGEPQQSLKDSHGSSCLLDLYFQRITLPH